MSTPTYRLLLVALVAACFGLPTGELTAAEEQDSIVLVVAEVDETEEPGVHDNCVHIPGVVHTMPGDAFSQISVRGRLPHESKTTLNDIEVHAACIDGMEPAHTLFTDFAQFDVMGGIGNGRAAEFTTRVAKVEELEASVALRAGVMRSLYKADVRAAAPVGSGAIVTHGFIAMDGNYEDGNGRTVADSSTRGGLALQWQSDQLSAGYIGQFTGFNAYAQLLMDTRHSRSNLMWTTLKVLENEATSLAVTAHAQFMYHEMDDYNRTQQEIRNREFMPNMYMPMYSHRSNVGVRTQAVFSDSNTIRTITMSATTEKWDADMDMIAMETAQEASWMSNIANVERHRIVASAEQSWQFAHHWLAVKIGLEAEASHLLDRRGARMLAGWVGEVEPRSFLSPFAEIEYGTNTDQSTSKLAFVIERVVPTERELYAFFFSDPYDEVAIVGNPRLQGAVETSLSYSHTLQLSRYWSVESTLWTDLNTDEIRALGDEVKQYQHIGTAVGAGATSSLLFDGPTVGLRFSADIHSRYSCDLETWLPTYSQPSLANDIVFSLDDIECGLSTVVYLKSPFESDLLHKELANQTAVVSSLRTSFRVLSSLSAHAEMYNLFDTFFVPRGASRHVPMPGRYLSLSLNWEVM